MDIDSLRYFVEVCRAGTLTHAAERLCVTQQAVSRKIIMLEEELGVSLFLRTTRGMVPTDSGLLLRQKADNMLEIAQDIRTSIGSSAQQRRGHLKVGFSPGTLFTLGMENVMQLLASHSDWQFDLDEYNDRECELRVLDGTLDIAFTIIPEEQPDLIYRSICRDNYVVLMGKQHPLAKKNSVSLQDVARYPQVALDDTFRMQGQLSQRFREMGLLPYVRTRINHDLTIAYELITDNASLFVFVEGLISESVMRRNVCLPLQEPELRWDIGVIARPETMSRAPVIDELAAECLGLQKQTGAARESFFPG